MVKALLEQQCGHLHWLEQVSCVLMPTHLLPAQHGVTNKLQG